MENCHHYFSLTYFHVCVCVWVANVYTFYYTITLSLLDILKSTLHIKHIDICTYMYIYLLSTLTLECIGTYRYLRTGERIFV